MNTSLENSCSRREFMKLGAAGGVGLLIGIPLPGAADSSPSSVYLHPLIRIANDGRVTLYAQNPEMGQGVKTSLPMIVAEELAVDWRSVTVLQADGMSELARQFSGGSLSIRLNFDAMRQAGASAREMLVAAAADHWQLPLSRLEARAGQVVDMTSGDRLGYGELAAAAARLPVPEQPALKSPEAFSIIGTPVADVDLQDIVTGRQQYGFDLRLPGMLYASVARSPHGDGQPVSFDSGDAEEIPGVVGFEVLKNIEHGGRIVLPNCPNFVSGVAVLAENAWAALQGAGKLVIDWQLPDLPDDSRRLRQEFARAVDGSLDIVRDDGDIDTAASHATVGVDVQYSLPFLAHVTMEPMNCTADVTDDGAELWVPTQNPQMVVDAISTALTIDPGDITVHLLRCGGGFGRRFYADFAVDAALLSRRAGRPVKVIWTREDDIRHDYFRPASLQNVRAGLNAGGDLSYWHHKVVSHPRETYLERDGSPAEIANYEFPAAFVPNLKFEYAPVTSRIPVGQWRAVEHSSNVFVVSSVIDELANAAGIDTVEFWLSLIGNEQYVQVREDFRFDASRLARVVKKAAAAADWGNLLGEGSGRGIAASYNQGSWVAEVAEATVDSGRLRVDRIVAAVDCGLVVNPLGARKQIESAIIEGLSATLMGQITVSDGRVEQSNFHDYRICRMHQIPRIEVHFVESTDAPRGLGEPPLPPVAPAVCNAIFAATGERLRQLPLSMRFSV